MGEAIRSGIQSVGRGQWHAAEASGLSFLAVMRLVILPQALALALPPLTNQWVRLVKNTSLLSVVAGGDVLYHAIEISGRTFAVLPVYMTIAVAYLTLTVPLSRAADFFGERIAWRRAALRHDRWASSTLGVGD
jgi:putative glutamine transport system permease protein